MNRSFPTTLVVLTGLALSTLHADPVPQVISYQGRLADTTGAPMAATAPINRKMVFSLYDAPTGGTRVWTEQQFVTISAGEFSVLLGNGTPLGAFTHGPLDKVFSSGSTSLYLELQVDNGDTVIDAADTPISPRQRIVTSGFAFRTHSAESITSGSDLRFLPSEQTNATNHGLGFYDAARPFNSVNIGGPVLYGQGGGALGSSNGSDKNLALTWLANGNVGIGVSSPTERLHVAGSIKATGTMNAGGSVTAGGAVSTTGAITSTSVTSTGPVTGGPITGTSLSIKPATTGSSEVAGISATGKLNITKGGTMNGPTGDVLNITSAGKIKIRELVVTGTVTASSGGSTAEVLSAQKRLVLSGATGWGDSVASTPGAPAEGPNASTGMRLILDGNNASTDLIGFGLATSTRLFSITPPTGRTSWYGGTTEQMWLNGANGQLNTKNLNIGNTTTVPEGQLAMEGSNFARLTLSQTATGMEQTKNLVLTNRADGRAELGWLRADGTSVASLLTFKRTTTDPQITDQVGDYGYVGINTTQPKAPLHVVQSDGFNGDIDVVNELPTKPVTTPPTSDADHRRAYGVHVGTDGGVMTAGGFGTYHDNVNHRYEHIAAIFEGDIVTRRSWFGTGLDTSSDARAKHIIGLTNNEQDLGTLMKLQVTDYHWIDRSIDLHRPHKRLIAQQVAEVFPQASRISPMPQAIPNVYELATHLSHDAATGILTITTHKPHEFRAGDLVDLIGDQEDLKETKVESVLDAHRFTVTCKSPPKQLFVYGKQVKDFRTVDYDAISMLNLSATQALKKRNDLIAAANKQLRDQVQQLEKRRKALEKARDATDAKFAALEALLNRQSAPAATTASLRK